MDEKDIINMIPIDEETANLANDIISETDFNKTQQMVKLFNLQQAKKNVLRVLKLNSLLDKVSDQMITRFTQRPDEFNNNDLLQYLQVTQSAIDRANKALNLVDEAPAIQINQQVNNINVGEPLDRDSKIKIAEAVKAILEKSKQLNVMQSDELVIEADDAEDEIEPVVYKLNDEEENG